ncbi:MAG: nucleotidyltransferase domain-containing protein [Candidatus Woesearchaeota archaeon]
MKSKEKEILELIFNSTKQWHFTELLEAVKIGRPQLARWLALLEKEKIIKRIKRKGKMPYYVHNFEAPEFKIRKKMHAYEKLYKSGLLGHLASLKGAKTVILFGSFSREDWYADSDIDLFIYGSDSGLKKAFFESKLGRAIQVHSAKNNKDIQKISKLLPYIISGNFIKGSVADLGVEINAKA